MMAWKAREEEDAGAAAGNLVSGPNKMPEHVRLPFVKEDNAFCD